LTVKKKQRREAVEVDDVVFSAGARKVSGFLVRPKGKLKAAVLWSHWYPSEPNSNRTEFLPDAVALAKKGSSRFCRKGCFRGSSR
jgi:hypothetical protein